MPDDPLSFNLTHQELACVRLAGQRLNNQEIADQLGIAVGTVKNHLSRASAKVGAPGRLATAKRLGLLVTVTGMHIPADLPIASDGSATGDEPSATNSRRWPFPSPPPGGLHRLGLILIFFVVGCFIITLGVLTVVTTMDLAADRAPPNAIRAIE